MHPSDIGDKIESFMRTAFRIAPDDPGFNRTIDLFEAGYVDSIGVMETLAFIANEFNIEVPESELLDDAFANIDGMARIVARLIAENDADSVRPIRAIA